MERQCYLGYSVACQVTSNVFLKSLRVMTCFSFCVIIKLNFACRVVELSILWLPKLFNNQLISSLSEKEVLAARKSYLKQRNVVGRRRFLVILYGTKPPGDVCFCNCNHYGGCPVGCPSNSDESEGLVLVWVCEMSDLLLVRRRKLCN